MGRSEMERKVRSQWKLGTSESLGSRCRGRRTERQRCVQGNGRTRTEDGRGAEFWEKETSSLLQHRGPQ